MARPDQEPANSQESSILQNPAVIFEKVDSLKNRFYGSDYQKGEAELIEWLDQQWIHVYEVLDSIDINQKINGNMTYNGKVIHAGSRETTTFHIHGEFNVHEIDLEFVTAMPWGHLELQEVIATMVSSGYVSDVPGTFQGLEVTRTARINCNRRPLEIETEVKERIGSVQPKVGNVVKVGEVRS